MYNWNAYVVTEDPIYSDAITERACERFTKKYAGVRTLSTPAVSPSRCELCAHLHSSDGGRHLGGRDVYRAAVGPLSPPHALARSPSALPECGTSNGDVLLHVLSKLHTNNNETAPSADIRI